MRYLSNSSRAMALELWAQEERHAVQMAAMRRQMQRALQAAARCLGQNVAASGSSHSRAAGAASTKLRDRADLSRQRSKELGSQFNAALARAGLRENEGSAEHGGESSDSETDGPVLADLDTMLKAKGVPEKSSFDDRAEQPDGSVHGSAWDSEPPSPMPPASAAAGTDGHVAPQTEGDSSTRPLQESKEPAATTRTATSAVNAAPAAVAAEPAPAVGFFSSFFNRGGPELQNV